MSMRFSNIPVLVTAAASGIGAATAEAFANEGARVMLSDINEEAGEEVSQRLRAAGCDANFVHADATVDEEVDRLVHRTVEVYGGLVFAANVVGGVIGDAFGPDFHLQSQEGWASTVELCLTSTFLSMKHEIAHMVEHGGGSIVNVSSLQGTLFVPEGGVAYSAAKAGVIRLTKFAAVNYADRGIRANCISPGITLTPPVLQGAGPHAGGDELIERMLMGHAIKRPIEPSEQAAVILWLCSAESAMVTGHNLPVDGGWSAR
jgi:NAD(P)-dependent dehydrogenase (short-subunit alcohol dehydrogenase family)